MQVTIPSFSNCCFSLISGREKNTFGTSETAAESINGIEGGKSSPYNENNFYFNSFQNTRDEIVTNYEQLLKNSSIEKLSKWFGPGELTIAKEVSIMKRFEAFIVAISLVVVLFAGTICAEVALIDDAGGRGFLATLEYDPENIELFEKQLSEYETINKG